MEKEALIEKYFEGKLSAKETVLFEKLLQEDEVFAAAFEFEKNVKKAIRLNKRSELKATFQNYEKQKKSLKWLYAAASIAVIMGVFTWNSFNNTNYNSLYNEYYQTYQNTFAPTVRGQSSVDLKSKAFLAYDSGEYQTASVLFTEIYNSTSEDYALFYKGICLMELEKYKEALEIFNTNSLNQNPSFASYSKWYAALANLKLENKDEAISILETLAKTENPQQKVAVKLLDELK